MFADAGVHPSAGHSPIEWHAAVEAATTRHDEIIRAVEASSTADEALEGARQSAAETHDALAAALAGDAAAATAALDDRDEATAACCATAAAARDAGTALAARVAEHRTALKRHEVATHAAHTTHTAALAALGAYVRAALCANGEARGRDSAALGAALVGARVCEFKLLATRARATQRAAASSANDARRAL